MTLEERLKFTKYEVVTKKVKHIQKEDLNIEFLFDFYIQPENRDIVLKIFDNDKYIMAWVEEADNCYYNSNETIIYDFLNNIYQGEVDTDIDCSCIEELFVRFYKTVYIAVKGTDNGKYAKFIHLKNVDRIIWDIRTWCRQKLFSENIQSYVIGIPNESMSNKNGNCGKVDRLFWVEERKQIAKKFWSKMSDTPYEKAKKYFFKSIEDEIDKNDKPKIFLIGPCLVDGSIHTKEDSLLTLLKEKISEYDIVKIVEWERFNEKLVKILEQDIRENDIVIFIDSYYEKNAVDIDMELIFEQEITSKWLYTDIMIHTSRFGNDIIVREILNHIIVPLRQKNKNVYSDVILHRKEEQWITPELVLYIDEIKKGAEKKFNSLNGAIGCIVMNANPFTKGHQYLIEYASSQVDFLYVFVVEEDSSEIPFFVRKQLVEEGTKDLDNVFVIRSGKFIASKETFEGYFKKYLISAEEVDVSKDLHIFASVIAKGLGISKRFVGEEPLDAVTRKYNEGMKDIFPKYGIEVIEIPRKEMDNHVISASIVRKCLHEKNWIKLETLVPKSTYEYFYLHQKDDLEKFRFNFIERMKEEEILRTKDWFLSHDNIVIYGIGQNAEFLMSILPENIVDSVRFCDKKAREKIVYFGKQKVLSPEELTAEDNIFISSTKYGKEIYEELYRQGFVYNLYNFSVFALQ